MATNRRDRGKGDGSQDEDLLSGGRMPSEPEVVSVTVYPSPTLAAQPAPAPQGDIWVSLLESSPWSANHGGRVEAAQPPPALARPAESASVGDLVSRWSQPIWRTPSRFEEAEASEGDVVVVNVEVSQPISPDTTVSVPDLVIEVHPIQVDEEVDEDEDEDAASGTLTTSLDRLIDLAEGLIPDDSVTTDDPAPAQLAVEIAAEPEFESPMTEADLDVAPIEVVTETVTAEAEPAPEFETEPELVPAEAVSEPVAEVTDETVAAPAPAANLGFAELMKAAEAMAPVLISSPSVASAAKPVGEPAKKKKAAPVRKKASAVQEVPVQDLLGGIFGVAGSAARGVFNLGAGVIGGVLKGGRVIGNNVAAGARRLTGAAEGSCGTCSTSQCDSGDKKNSRQP